MLKSIAVRIERFAEGEWHTNAYGLARTLLAFGTLGTLAFSHSSTIFRPAVGMPIYPHCDGRIAIGIFCIAGPEHLEIARWLCIAALAFVACGARPRVTGVLHWYVCWSLFTSGVLVDGGDQISAVLSLLLLPVTLTDARRWHWDPPVERRADARRPLFWRLFARSCLTIIRLQVAGIYFQAAVAKMRVPEWRDGTAVYYWFTDPGFGFYEPILGWMMPLLANGLIVTTLTFSAMMLEICLFAGLFAVPAVRRVLLAAGVGFHTAIAAVHGLPSFALAMWSALLLFLYPLDREVAWLATGWQSLRRRAGRWGSRTFGAQEWPTAEGPHSPLAGIAE